eukprot:scaffold14397_cov80-Skeletonema_menzelii.AAC.3
MIENSTSHNIGAIANSESKRLVTKLQAINIGAIANSESKRLVTKLQAILFLCAIGKKGWAGLLSTGELSKCWKIINFGKLRLSTPPPVRAT